MERYVCIHGHFYQPPRENPWIEAIDLQDSAYPYHDWNRRITAECYAPNAKSRILDEKNRILRLVNNYSRMSYNFGPTLLSWLERNSTWVYEAIQEADKESARRYAGHGSALAQAYSHMIMPLANRRDKVTQVRWGIQDFVHRFGRSPEGMWLPETAVDLETLDILAEMDIRFTILSPYQAGRIRPQGTEAWQDVTGGKIDPTTAYTQQLPSGRSIALFFYDGIVSRAVAFEKLLQNGGGLVGRLLGAFTDTRSHAQLVHIATDGESYGHHHRFGDMALAYALEALEAGGDARLTNYGEFLERHPPTHDVEIIEGTSWSCAHGVERWRKHCGCNTGAHPDWNQQWREPLRETLDTLRDTLAPAFETEARKLLKDPWIARDRYISVLLECSGDTRDRFFREHGTGALGESGRRTALQLLELQRHAMLMYTSCGWFFDDISGIETIQILQYAGRLLQLARDALGMDLREAFLKTLQNAKSNVPEKGDGRRIYEESVEPGVADLKRVCAHYAISSLFEEYASETEINCYRIKREDQQAYPAGKTRLLIGRAEIRSILTTASSRLLYCVLHLGDHTIVCGVGDDSGAPGDADGIAAIRQAFEGGDVPEAIRRIDGLFPQPTYTLKSLFRDLQRKIVHQVLAPAMEHAEVVFRQLHANHAHLIRFLMGSGSPVPKEFTLVTESLINSDLKRAFEQVPLDQERIKDLLDEARLSGLSLDHQTLEYALRKSVESMAEILLGSPEDPEALTALNGALDIQARLPFQLNLWTVQNICYSILETRFPVMKDRAEGRPGEGDAQKWIQEISSLAEKLSLRVPETGGPPMEENPGQDP